MIFSFVICLWYFGSISEAHQNISSLDGLLQNFNKSTDQGHKDSSFKIIDKTTDLKSASISNDINEEKLETSTQMKEIKNITDNRTVTQFTPNSGVKPEFAKFLKVLEISPFGEPSQLCKNSSSCIKIKKCCKMDQIYVFNSTVYQCMSYRDIIGNTDLFFNITFYDVLEPVNTTQGIEFVIGMKCFYPEYIEKDDFAVQLDGKIYRINESIYTENYCVEQVFNASK